jgi:DNA-binding GntR family transcriptional regulator
MGHKAPLLQFRREGDAPLYSRVVAALQQDIATGRIAVGARLPSEEELCGRFGVSRHTVREALRKLREDGLVSSRQGAGTTVVRKSGAPPLYTHSVGSIDELVQYAEATRYRAKSTGAIAAGRDLAQRLGCAIGTQWIHLDGFRYVPGEDLPFCWTEVYLSAAYAGVADLVGKKAGPIYALIEEIYGEKVTEIEQTLRVVTLPEAVAPGLRVEPGSAAVEIRRAYRLATGELAEVAFNLHPADRFSYSLTLRRRR